MKCWQAVLLALALVATGTTGCDKEVKPAEETEASAEAPEADEDKNEEAKTEEKAEDGEPPLLATGPVAVVNGTEITAEEFNTSIQRRLRGAGSLPPRLAPVYKRQTLDRLIDKELINQKLAETDIEVSDEAVDQKIAEFKERFPNEEVFAKFLESNNVSEEEFREDMRKSQLLEAFLKQQKGIEVSEADAKKYYEENPQHFERQNEVRARHILIKADKDADEKAVAAAKEKAQAIAEEAKKPGTDFAELAKAKSEGPSAPKGGDLGYFSKGRMVPEFSEAAFAMKPGEVSDPVKTQFGFHVIKVEDKREAGTVPFAEAKEQIIAQLERQKIGQAMQEFMKELKEGAKIERKEDNIKVNVEAPAEPQGAKNPMQGGKLQLGNGKKLELKNFKFNKPGADGQEKPAEQK